MNAHELIDTARSLVAGDKGLLAMDESNPTCNKRFASLGIPQTVEARRAYRELIVTTPGLGECISGAILYDETFRQNKKDGASWSLSTQYKVNDVVVYGGYVYRCTTAHTSAATVALGLEANQSAWQVVYQQLFYQAAWQVSTRYRVLDVVRFDGALYICATAHTSSAFLNDFNSGLWFCWSLFP